MQSWRNFRRLWKKTPKKSRIELFKGLSDEERAAINWWYVSQARDKQVPPDWDWFIWLILSGRGFGKTRSGAEWVHERARQGLSPIALVGQTKADVRDTMIEAGESSLMKTAPPDFIPEYQPSKRRVVWPNGAFATAFSGDEPDQLRGPEHRTAWVDEPAKFKYPQQTYDNLMFGLRLPPDPRAVFTTTPRPIPIIKNLIKDPDVAVVYGSSYENMDNLSEVFRRNVLKKYEGTRLGRQEIYGQILDDVPGALWSRDLLEELRVTEYQPLMRIGVGVDPAATTGEHGIVVAGVVKNGGELHGYVLEDGTRPGSPGEWGSAVVAMYHKYNADIIVGEVNNGGDMIENTIRNVKGGRNVAYKSVRASRGKYVRAEPVANLYEQKRVHHVGFFDQLEEQQCSYLPGDEDKSSPNNLDALVWVLTELMLEYEEHSKPGVVSYA